jgi:hypothetical protein
VDLDDAAKVYKIIFAQNASQVIFFLGARAGFPVQVLDCFGFASTSCGLSPATPGAFVLKVWLSCSESPCQ